MRLDRGNNWLPSHSSISLCNRIGKVMHLLYLSSNLFCWTGPNDSRRFFALGFIICHFARIYDAAYMRIILWYCMQQLPSSLPLPRREKSLVHPARKHGMFVMNITGSGQGIEAGTLIMMSKSPKWSSHSSLRNIKPPFYSIMKSQLIPLPGKRNQPQGSQHIVWEARRFVFCPDLLGTL